MKVIFERTRPTYAKQSEFYSIYGEWFSFPSGHSLRAFYWMFWLSRSRFVKLIAPIIHFPRARYFIPWACIVGWSRVAKARHFVLDVIAGAVIGSILGYLVEDYFGQYGRAVIKTISGIYTAACWGYLVVIPYVGGPTAGVKRTIVAVLFYAFAVTLLIETLPNDLQQYGEPQTIRADIDGFSSECLNYW